MDVGMMSLPDEIWSRGKCSFKMLQYMACGVPVVVSSVGASMTVDDRTVFAVARSSRSDSAAAPSRFV
jgi:glycosyltransferase involved in cell wall biosynthesis